VLKPNAYGLPHTEAANDLDAALSLPDDHHGERRAAELLRKMQARGTSKYHPDPLAAIEEAEAAERG
jgi:hypothetical protein